MKIQTKYGEVHVLTNCPLLQSTERLEWLTKITEYYGGNEDREPARDAPRQILSFSYVEMRQEMGDLFHMLSANLRKQWGIPLVYLKRDIPNIVNDDFIPMETASTLADLKLGYALVRTDTSHQVVELIQIGRYIITQEEIRDNETQEIIQELKTEFQDGFRLSGNITAINAVIIPLRICIIDGDASINTGGFWSNSSVVFRVIAEDLPEHDGAMPIQYKGFDFYSKPLLLDGDSLEMTLTQHQNIVDNDVGGFQQFTHWSKAKYSKPFKSLLKSQSDFIDFRKFLFRRMGRFREFWLPLYEKHLNVVSTGILADWFEVDTAYVIEADRKHIAVKISGAWSAHEVTNKVINGKITRLTVSPALNVQRSKIQSICYLGLHRFDADQVEFQFLGNNISKTTVLIQEVLS